MEISISDLVALVRRCMTEVGFDQGEAALIADHLVDCELRGVAIGGVSRALSIVDRVRNGPPPGPMTVVKETSNSALIDGGDQAGYLVAHRATQLGIEKAKKHGIAVIGANNTWYTGMYAYYMEMATREGLVAMAMGSSSPRVAPYGASEGRFGTNPIAFGLPSTDQPIILDLGTSSIMVGDAVLHSRLGEDLAEGCAYAADGTPTVDPAAALAGAFTVWGGHKGSGLAMIVQLMGIMVGGGAMPGDYRDCGYLFIALRPDLFMPLSEFRARAGEYADKVRTARPLDPDAPPRMPFDRSAATRDRARARGSVYIPDALYEELLEIAQ